MCDWHVLIPRGSISFSPEERAWATGHISSSRPPFASPSARRVRGEDASTPNGLNSTRHTTQWSRIHLDVGSSQFDLEGRGLGAMEDDPPSLTSVSPPSP